MAEHYDLVKVATATAGTGTPLSLGAASPGFRDFVAAAVPDGTLVSYAILDQGEHEACEGTYDQAAGTITRTTLSSSTGSALNLSGQSVIYLTVLARDVPKAPADIGAAPASHAHPISDVSNLQAELDGKSSTSHGHSNATPSAAGFMSASDKTKVDGLGGITWQTISANYTASANTYLMVAGGVTVTLPSAPSAGDFVECLDLNSEWGTTSMTVDGNGQSILGATTFTADVTDQPFSLVYNGTEWKLGMR